MTTLKDDIEKFFDSLQRNTVELTQYGRIDLFHSFLLTQLKQFAEEVKVEEKTNQRISGWMELSKEDWGFNDAVSAQAAKVEAALKARGAE